MTGSRAFGDARFDRIEMEASLRRLYAPSYQKVMSSLMGASCDAQAIFSSTSTR
jgi:hypothetical protein